MGKEGQAEYSQSLMLEPDYLEDHHTPRCPRWLLWKDQVNKGQQNQCRMEQRMQNVAYP